MPWIFRYTMFLFCLSGQGLLAQVNCASLDTIAASDIKLEMIDLNYGNTYIITTRIDTDSLIFMLPSALPKGYYEGYYEADSNKLALVYYNFGRKSYVQQFYKDGSIKSDSEYDAYGNMHGLHVIYNRDGDELLHIDYYHGQPEEKYTLAYLKVFNYTKELMQKGKAWGCYEFSPTPMRERHDQILLKENGRFSYHNFLADCNCRRHSEGKWIFENGLLKLTIDNKTVWNKKTKYYALIANHRQKRVRMIEVMPWGLHWYVSEYWFCKKCECREP